jgi:hypothetical protein
MRRAGSKRTASFHASAALPTRSAPCGLTARREPDNGSSSAVDEPTADVLLSPAGTFTNPADIVSESRNDRRRQLAIAIRQRIESRLPGRVRNLAVRISDHVVLLEGQCATYYTKQLAQHAALGILEDEQLENAILVGVTR